MSTEASVHHGSIVVLEGPPDTISIQLRLLPAAPHILILPSLQTYIDEETSGRSGIKRLVRRVHEAVEKRHAVALDFLRQATPERKRLVFMNGGTIGAQALCLSTIRDQEAGGDWAKAESFFREAILDGVEGLLVDVPRPPLAPSAPSVRPAVMDTHGQPGVGASDEGLQDPRTRAMRAASALYRETESLQPAGYDVDLDLDMDVIRRVTRRCSLPSLIECGPTSTDPFFLALRNTFSSSLCESTYTQSRNGRVSTDPMPQGTMEMLSTVCRRPLRVEVIKPSAKSSAAEEVNYNDSITMSLSLPHAPSEANSPVPRSPEPVFYGEATVVQMPHPSAKPLRRARSLDRIFVGWERRPCADPSSPHPRSGKTGRPVTASRESMTTTATPTAASRATRRRQKRPSSYLDIPARRNTFQPIPDHSEYQRVPKTRFVKAKKTTISRSNTIAGRSSRKTSVPTRVASTAERGIVRFPDRSQLHRARSRRASPSPVLPFTEDLMILFSDGERDESFERALAACKEALSSSRAQQSSAVAEAEQSAAATATATAPNVVNLVSEGTEASEQTVCPADRVPSEYDPFASHGDYGMSVAEWVQRDSTERLRDAAAQPLAPAATSPPQTAEKDPRFYTLPIVGQTTAVLTQNYLRSVLSIYFPPHDKSYHQPRCSLFPNTNGLWNPMLRDVDPTSWSKKGRKIDLILAIGAQPGVRKEFSAAITGQVEKLGDKSSGLSRSGRLDIRCVSPVSLDCVCALKVLTLLQVSHCKRHASLRTSAAPKQASGQPARQRHAHGDLARLPFGCLLQHQPRRALSSSRVSRGVSDNCPGLAEAHRRRHGHDRWNHRWR